MAANSGWFVGPCHICHSGMTFVDVRESVYWLPRERHHDWGFWGDPEHVLAHRRCWKELSEGLRKRIRNEALRGHEPRSFGNLI